MNLTLKAVGWLGVFGSLMFGEQAQADNKDMLNERISSTACQPRSSSDRSKIEWSGNAWMFKAGETGTILFECPIFTPFEDENNGQRTLSELRLWYQDGDGTSTIGRVEVELRNVSGTSGSLTSVFVDSLSSNTSGSTILNVINKSLAAASMNDSQYFAVVTMFRSGTGVTVRFRGVSFFTSP